MGPSYFLLRSLLFLSQGSLGEAFECFYSFGFYLFPATFTLWAFIPFFPQGKVQPFASLENPMPKLVQGINEREYDEK
jgi:hypothetical protein